MQSHIIKFILLAAILVCMSCNSENCPPSEDLGRLYWSPETQKWIPDEYLTFPKSLIYVSEENEEIEFALEISEILEGSSFNIKVICESGKDESNYRYSTPRYIGRFSTSDSLSIFFGFGVRNEILGVDYRVEPDFYEWVSVSMRNFNHKSVDSDYGDVKVITDLRNAELEDLDHLGNSNIFNPTIAIGGEIFENVYSRLTPSSSPANIFLKQGEGIVAFIDEEGVAWKLRP